MLSGGLGATFGALFSGVILSRYNAPIGVGGAFGVLGGFIGYNMIKYYGEDECAEIFICEHGSANRKFFRFGYKEAMINFKPSILWN